MTRFLLDTNILSEFARRGEPHPKVRQWLNDTDDQFLFISVLALAEIRQGVELCDPGKRKDDLTRWLDNDLRLVFVDRLLPVTLPIAERWGVLSAHMQRRGTPLPVIDGLMAATALEHGLTVATRNGRHFEPLGTAVFDPWQA